jgi:hypothetical protein
MCFGDNYGRLLDRGRQLLDKADEIMKGQQQRIQELEAMLREIVINGDNSDFPGDHPFRQSIKKAVQLLGDDPR